MTSELAHKGQGSSASECVSASSTRKANSTPAASAGDSAK